jgi:deoxypyrimidine-specific 5' nucleotidase type C protein (NT5C)
MSLRIGFDMDGVLADFSKAYHQVEKRVFGEEESARPGDPEDEHDDDEAAEESSPRQNAHRHRRRRDAVWASIRATPDFWAGLDPIDPGAVARLHQLMLQHRWEVFFITQRPATLGDTVQRQTQRWLIAQGFDMPSVLVIPGSRGAAGSALSLHYHVDDSATNCVDMKSESKAKPILIVGDDDPVATASARRLGIGTARDVSAALDILDKASSAKRRPHLLQQIGKLVGWT